MRHRDHEFPSPKRLFLFSLIFPQACLFFTYPEIVLPLPLEASRNSSSSQQHRHMSAFLCQLLPKGRREPAPTRSVRLCLTTAVSRSVSLLAQEQQRAAQEGDRLCQPLPDTLTAAKSSPSLRRAGTKPSPFHSWPSAGSFPRNHPPFSPEGRARAPSSTKAGASVCWDLHAQMNSSELLKTGFRRLSW